MLLTDDSLALIRMSQRLVVRRKAMMGQSFLNTFLQHLEERSKLKYFCVILFMLGSLGLYVKMKGTRSTFYSICWRSVKLLYEGYLYSAFNLSVNKISFIPTFNKIFD